MDLQVSISTIREFRVGDRPKVKGRVFDTSPSGLNLTDLLFYMSNGQGDYITDTLVDSYDNESGAFEFTVNRTFPQYNTGYISLIGLSAETITATLDTGVTAGVGVTDTITISAGSIIQTTGWCKIENEWCFYSYDPDTLTLTLAERGLFNTDAATHAATVSISFAYSKQTAVPRYEFNVLNKRYQ